MYKFKAILEYTRPWLKEKRWGGGEERRRRGNEREGCQIDSEFYRFLRRKHFPMMQMKAFHRCSQ